MDSSQYSLIGLDLSKLEDLQNLLEKNKVDYCSSTLIFSECALTYIESQ